MYAILQVIMLRLRLMLQDRIFLFLLLLFPFVFVFILHATQSFEKQPIIPVAVADEDQSDYSKLIVERFAAKEGIRVHKVSRDEAYRLTENYKVEAAFVIKKGLQEAIIDEDTDETVEMLKNPGSLSYGILGEMLGSEVMRLSANTGAANRAEQLYQLYGLTPPAAGSLWERVFAYADAQWEPEPLMTIEYKEMTGGGLQNVTRVTNVSNAALTGMGMLLVFVLLFVMLHSRWLLEERDNGTLKRIISAPGMLWKFYAGNIAALALLSLFLIGVCAVLARFVFGASLVFHPLQYVLLAAYTFAAISLGMLFSALFRTSRQLETGAPLLALLTGFAGGCFWPFLPLVGMAKIIALCTPQGIALAAMKPLAAGDVQWNAVVQPLLLLLGFGIIVFAYSFYRIRRQAVS
ncbi:ABC transporter permease [Aneurinibacillus sp. REN35]|uniref:ABC transporter permease n=1 Tax=Aneurinibacillus sp. REN35 TaxID=3237286 RepID=UPI0035291A65